MPNWKKLIVSGSDATLNSLEVTNQVTGSSFTGSFSGSFNGDGSGLSGIDAFPYTGSASVSGSFSITGSTGFDIQVSNLTLSLDYTAKAGTKSTSYSEAIADGTTITVETGAIMQFI